MIVVIATSNKRTDLLLKRSLQSVYEQKNVNPRAIFIIDDNEKKNPCDDLSTEFYNLKWRVRNFRIDYFKDRFSDGEIPEWFFHTTVLPNKRTHGNSGTGAWNTALYHSLQYGKNNYIAILDDDDEWRNDYLFKCLAETKIENGCSDKKFVLAVVSGIKRIGDGNCSSIVASEETFTLNSFFVGNPGFYGSSIFVRLRELLTVGGFDESMSSATDRDLAIRLIELYDIHHEKNDHQRESYYNYKNPEIRFINELLVFHHTEGNDRVTSNPTKKRDGLDKFYRKYLHRMDYDIREKSLRRAKSLFAYDYKDKPLSICTYKELDNFVPNCFNLLIGVISENANNLKELLNSFENLPNKHLLTDYKILILENTKDEYEVRPLINYLKEKKGLNIELIDIEEQKEIASIYPFSNVYSKENIEHKSISFSRSLLQFILYNKCKELYDEKVITWIIDDDLMFNNLTYDEKGRCVTKSFDYLSIISKLGHEKKVHAILGTVTDTPPIPFLSTLRTQMLDLCFNLKWFEKQNPEEIYQYNSIHNLHFMKENRDFYYDLSSEYYEHLECPFWWSPVDKVVDTINEAFCVFLDEISLLSKGLNVFRPLILFEEKWGEDKGESIFRGGNTVIYDPEMLKIPNLITEINKDTQNIVPRRSDFNWAIINKNIFNKKIVEINIPLRHHRRLQEYSLIYDQEKIQRDLYGMVFYRCLSKVLENKIDEIDDTIYKEAVDLFGKNYSKYIQDLKINIARSEFLLEIAIRTLSNEKNWWYKNEYRNEINDKIENARSSLKILAYTISKRRMQEFIRDIDNDWNLIEKEDFKIMVESIKECLIQYHTAYKH